MHIQNPPNNWLDAVNFLPDYASVKSVSDAAPLLEAKQRWISLGRDPKKLTTVYRHFDIEPAPIGTWDSALAHWRRMFARYIDKTWLERYVNYVDLVLDCNEYTAQSTWTDPVDKKRVLQSMQAAAFIWNTEYRGQEVHSADGGVGIVPATCKFVLMCGPVNNAFPVEVFDLAVQEDCPISYHAYTRYQNKQRYVNDWQDDSGLWNFLEIKFNRKPQWLFGESGPYLNAAEGWRSQNVLGADEDLLVGAMSAWWTDISKTTAYAEGRIFGPGNWFTSGGGTTWQFYELQSQQLIKLAKKASELWKPGAEMSNPSVDRIREYAQAILLECDKLDPPGFQAKALIALTIRDKNGLQVSNPPTILKDQVFAVFEENLTAGPFERRARISADGRNVWQGGPASPSYVKV